MWLFLGTHVLSWSTFWRRGEKFHLIIIPRVYQAGQKKGVDVIYVNSRLGLVCVCLGWYWIDGFLIGCLFSLHRYGLLGASGCGKTTLLSCIVGRRSFDSGEVLVFGGEPGSVESGIPGPRVGYMPQELALYGEFTIKETLEYFGRIYKLPTAFVKSQMEFLFNLLDLPPAHRYVKTLSGGQQRRVSFAVALFHEPELLILDEPTVGVDPLLRQRFVVSGLLFLLYLQSHLIDDCWHLQHLEPLGPSERRPWPNGHHHNPLHRRSPAGSHGKRQKKKPFFDFFSREKNSTSRKSRGSLA